MNGQNPENLNNNPMNSNVLGSVAEPIGTTPTPNVINQNGDGTPNVSNNTEGPIMGTPVTSASIAPVSPVGPMEVGQAPTLNVETPMVNATPLTNMGEPALTSKETTQSPTEPVAVPIPGTEGTPGIQNLTGNTIGSGNAPLMGNDSTNSNGFVEPKKVDNIGTIPPQAPKNEKNKKPLNKTLFIVLIIVLILAVAFGVYYFLRISNKVSLTPKNITIGVGEAIPDDIKDFANVKKGDVSTCRIDKDKIKPNVIGEYEYTITCGQESYKGKVIVTDKKAPIVTLKPVFKTATDNITVDDFIEKCTDDSGECENSLVDTNSVNNLAEGGPYIIKINSKDKNGNNTESEGELYIVKYAAEIFSSCSLPSENVEGYQATKITTDTFPIGHASDTGDIVLLQISRRDYKYKFASAEEYKKVVGAKPKTITFDNNVGTAIYDDENLTLTISTNLPWDSTIPTTFQGFWEYYNGEEKGYTCSNIKEYVR